MQSCLNENRKVTKMTDKEIIIDGVDVSGCKGFYIHDRSTTNIDYWMYGQCKSSKEYGCYCRNNPNCYYKQLARKTQECEELKKKLMQKSEVDMFFNTPIEGWSNDPCGICKFKNCLTEIKEIAEIEIECKTYEIENDCFNETRCKALNEHINFIKQILQKISDLEV